MRGDDLGPWVPEDVTAPEPGEYRFGLHSGIGGLAHVLAEIRLGRDLTPAEVALGEQVAEALVRQVPHETSCDYFDGLSSTVGALVALGAPGAEEAVARLAELATDDGWPAAFLGPPRAVAGASCNDATLGTASVLLGAVWADQHDVPGARELAGRAAQVLLDERVEVPTGLDWPFVPERFALERRSEMPNWSHGLAGIAGSLAAAGAWLGRPELVEAARLGAEHLLTLADTSDAGLRVPHVVPLHEDLETYTYGWCHGPTGTSLLFAALDRAAVTSVGGRAPSGWERACLRSVRSSGVPERLRPGFWDNDGRCCGTAGVADVVLSAWQRGGQEEDLVFAVRLTDALLDRAVHEGDHAFWRFVEHRNPDPLLPPGVGWMQGAAGIAAFLLRMARVLEEGRGAPAVARMDTWWAVPQAPVR